MGRKNRQRLLEDVLISGIGAEGKAIARVGNKVLFVPWVMPGDRADIRVSRERKNYLEGRLQKLITPSPERIEPFCIHFGTCGGCRWQHIPYPLQLGYKQKQVEDQLTRIGRLDLPGILPILPSEEERFYRNKLEFTFSGQRWLSREEVDSGEEISGREALGFHIPGRFDRVLDIGHCHLQPEPSDSIRLHVKKYALDKGLEFSDLVNHRGYLRNLTIRNNQAGEVMLIFSFYHDDPPVHQELFDDLLRTFPAIRSLQYAINNKANDSLYDLEIRCYHGEDHLKETMEDLQFRIGPKSFYQTNTRQALSMYRIIREWAQLRGKEVVYDLYSGTGTIALFLAGKAGRVVGVESVPEATEDAIRNAALNGVLNAEFITGDLKDVLKDDFFEQHGIPDLVVLDPPRAGVHDKVVRGILRAGPQHLIYVSCNPATQARDLALMAEHYRVQAVQPVDMFPHTHHVENIVLLGKK